MTLVISYPSSFSIQEVTITRQDASEKLGLCLRKNSKEASLIISGLNETSPLRHRHPKTAIRPGGGQLLLAVNGNPEMPKASNAVEMIQKGGTQLSLLICEQPPTPCMQVIATPYWKHSPGINFGSTRGRTLVTISKIFQRGPFTGNRYLREGDIVLAVNGIPVSKPEYADRALRLPITSNADNNGSSPVTILHTIDMEWFRGMVMNVVDQKKILAGITIVFEAMDKDDDHHNNNSQSNSYYKKNTTTVYQRQRQHLMIIKRQSNHHDDKSFPIEYDCDSQHMKDPDPYSKLHTDINAKISYKHWYSKGVLPYMELFNEIVDCNLDPLEDNACEHAWRSLPLLEAPHMAIRPPPPPAMDSGNPPNVQSTQATIRCPSIVQSLLHAPNSPTMTTKTHIGPQTVLMEIGREESEFISC